MTEGLYQGLYDFVQEHPPMGDRENMAIEFEGDEYESYDQLASALNTHIDAGEPLYTEKVDLDSDEGRERAEELASLADEDATLVQDSETGHFNLDCDPGDGMNALVDTAQKRAHYENEKNGAISEFFMNYNMLYTVRDQGDGLQYTAVLVSEEMEDHGCGAHHYTFPGEIAVLQGSIPEENGIDPLIDTPDETYDPEQHSKTLMDQVDSEIDTAEDPFLAGGEEVGKLQDLVEIDQTDYERYEELMLNVHDNLTSLTKFVQSYENFLEAFAEVRDWDERFGQENEDRKLTAFDLDHHRQEMREHLFELAHEDGVSMDNLRDGLIFTNIGAVRALYSDPEKRQRFANEHPTMYGELKNSGKQLSVSGISDLTATALRPEGEFHDPTDVVSVIRTMAAETGNGPDEYLLAYEHEAEREKERRAQLGNDRQAERMVQ
jgi:hypothetical protein